MFSDVTEFSLRCKNRAKSHEIEFERLKRLARITASSDEGPRTYYELEADYNLARYFVFDAIGYCSCKNKDDYLSLLNTMIQDKALHGEQFSEENYLTHRINCITELINEHTAMKG